MNPYTSASKNTLYFSLFTSCLIRQDTVGFVTEKGMNFPKYF